MVAKKKTAKKKTKKAKRATPAAAAAVKAAGLPTRPLKGLLTRKIREAQARKVLLFVSTGNTCRSPMATAYFKKLLEERKVRNIEVRSAGVMTIAGLLATDESKLMLEPYEVNLERHRSQPLTEEMIRRADLILGMTPFHVQMSLRLSDAARGKTCLLKEYAQTDPKNRPIPDPMGCTLEVYKRCFRQIKQACDRLIEMPFVTGKPERPARTAGRAGARSTAKAGAGRNASRAALTAAPSEPPGKERPDRRKPKAKSSAKSTAGSSGVRRTAVKKG